MSRASHPPGEYLPNRRKPRMGAALVEWSYREHLALVIALLQRGHGELDAPSAKSEEADPAPASRRRLH